MPGSRRGLVAPQNTFLESIIRKCSGAREYSIDFLRRSFIDVLCRESIRREKRNSVSHRSRLLKKTSILFFIHSLFLCQLSLVSIGSKQHRDAFDLFARALSCSLVDWPGSALVVIQFRSLQFLSHLITCIENE